MKPRQYNSWSPASACLKCPVLTAESPAWFSPNPLPGLTDPRSAYYNIPLGAIYLPVTGCVEVGPYIVGRILDESLPAFTGMVHHETAHEYMKTTLYRTAVRVSAARAYRALWQLFEGAGYESWCELQAANRAIASLMKSAGPIDELIATVLGVRQHKTSPTALPGEAARVERQFVTSQSAAGAYGREFRRQYEQLARIYERAQRFPPALLVDLAIAGTETSARVKLLLDTLDIEVRKRQTSELNKFRHEDWENLLRGNINDYDYWRNEVEIYSASLERQEQDLTRWWETHCPDANPMQTMVDLRDNRPAILAFAPTGDDFEWVKQFHSRWDSDLIAEVLAQVTKDREGGGPKRAIVIVDDENPTGNSGAVLYYQRHIYELGVTPKRTWSVPAWRHAVTLVRPKDAIDGPQMQSLIARWHEKKIQSQIRISTLAFLESARQAAAEGTGVRCPLRYCVGRGQSLPKCCGLASPLLMLWSAGRNAAERHGEELSNWMEPLECFAESDGHVPRMGETLRKAWPAWITREVGGDVIALAANSAEYGDPGTKDAVSTPA